MFMNTVKRITNLYRYTSVKDLNGYVAHYCYLRLISFDTFIKVVVEHKDYVSANCLLRMLGDSVAVFRLIYGESDKDLLLLRHALYVIDGCERNMKVLPEKNINEGCLPDDELVELNKTLHISREHRQRLMCEAYEILDASPLQHKDNAAFNKIVEERNWKFKDFKYYKNKGSNQYQWRELYKLIDSCNDFDLLSYLSQFAHGLSMSNLDLQMDEQNMNGVVGEALGLIKRLHKYTMDFFPKEQGYIVEGLFEPKIRDKILSCYDEQHRPNTDKWNQDVMNKLFQLRDYGFYEIIY